MEIQPTTSTHQQSVKGRMKDQPPPPTLYHDAMMLLLLELKLLLLLVNFPKEENEITVSHPEAAAAPTENS